MSIDIFHVYFLSLILFIYVVFVKRYKFAVVYCLIILINYILISANANIFFSKTFDGQHKLNLIFSKEQSLKQNFDLEHIVSSGTLVLADKILTPYVNINKGNILTKEVLNRGFKYYDWNVSSGDAGGAGSSTEVYNNVIYGVKKNRSNIVLMHDIKGITRDALRSIITYGKENGYSFERITLDTEMVTQRVNN